MQAGRRSSSDFFEFAAPGNVAPSQAANAGGGRSRRQYFLLVKDIPVVKPLSPTVHAGKSSAHNP
jgi:hypothetical protein